MPIKAPLLLKTSTNEDTIRKFIPENLFKAFQIITRKSQFTISDSRKLWSFKPVSQNLGTSNAKTHNTKLIGHKTSFPTQQAPSIDSQKRESYAQNTQTAEQETVLKPFTKIPFLKPSYSHTFHTTKSSSTCHNNNHNTTTSRKTASLQTWFTKSRHFQCKNSQHETDRA